MFTAPNLTSQFTDAMPTMSSHYSATQNWQSESAHSSPVRRDMEHLIHRRDESYGPHSTASYDDSVQSNSSRRQYPWAISSSGSSGPYMEHPQHQPPYYEAHMNTGPSAAYGYWDRMPGQPGHNLHNDMGSGTVQNNHPVQYVNSPNMRHRQDVPQMASLPQPVAAYPVSQYGDVKSTTGYWQHSDEPPNEPLPIPVPSAPPESSIARPLSGPQRDVTPPYIGGPGGPPLDYPAAAYGAAATAHVVEVPPPLKTSLVASNTYLRTLVGPLVSNATRLLDDHEVCYLLFWP